MVKITKITPTENEERQVGEPIVEGDGSGWNALGTHHIDPHQTFKDRGIAALDGCRKVTVFGMKY